MTSFQDNRTEKVEVYYTEQNTRYFFCEKCQAKRYVKHGGLFACACNTIYELKPVSDEVKEHD